MAMHYRGLRVYGSLPVAESFGGYNRTRWIPANSLSVDAQRMKALPLPVEALANEREAAVNAKFTSVRVNTIPRAVHLSGATGQEAALLAMRYVRAQRHLPRIYRPQLQRNNCDIRSQQFMKRKAIY